MRVLSLLFATVTLFDQATAKPGKPKAGGKNCGKPEEGDDFPTDAPSTNSTRRLAGKKCATGGMQFEVKGNSGKMMFYQDGKRNDGIVVEMESLTEIGADGVAVGTGKEGKHSFKNFKNQPFTISEMVESEYNGIKAYQSTFAANLGPGNFTVDVFLMMANGTITNGDEEIAVTAGQFKFTFTTEGWKYCNGTGGARTLPAAEDPTYCENKKKQPEVGEMLEFEMKIKSKSKPKAKGKSAKAGKRPPKEGGKHKPAEVDLGDGASLQLSSKVEVDGTWVDMPGADATDSYPKVEERGSSVYYTFRFPAGEVVFYDPGVDMGVPAAEFEAAVAAEEAEEAELEGDVSAAAPLVTLAAALALLQ